MTEFVNQDKIRPYLLLKRRERNPYLQRYRRPIPFKWVNENAILLMTLTDGEVTFPKLTALPAAQK